MEFLDIYQRKRSSKWKRVFREKGEGDEAKINIIYKGKIYISAYIENIKD